MCSADEILERAQWDLFWLRPGGATIVDRPEIRYLHSPDDQMYLNMVVRTRTSAARLPVVIDEVGAAHRHVRSRWLVCPHSEPASLADRLADHGYEDKAESYGYVMPVDAYQARAAPGISVRRVTTIQGLRDWYRVLNLAFGESIDHNAAELAAQLEVLVAPEERSQGFVAYDDVTEQPISAGDLRLYPALGFGYLLAGCTVPEARGRGAYSALLAHRIEVARRRGIGLVGLYAIVATSAPIVERLGFVRHGPMSYWVRPAE